MAEHEHHAASHDHASHDPDGVHVHVHSWKFYAGILGALLFLTIVTVATSYIDIDGFVALGEEVQGVGAYNLGLAILIATTKASLVVLFFMHLKDDARFNAVIFVGSVLFIGVFFAYTMNDTALRGTMDRYNGVRVDPDNGEAAPGGMQDGINGQWIPRGMPGYAEQQEAEAQRAAGAHEAAAGQDAPAVEAPAQPMPEPAPVEEPVVEPEAVQPEAVQPEAAQPEAAQPEAAQPEAAQPEAAQPEAAQPEAAAEPPARPVRRPRPAREAAPAAEAEPAPP
jgi:cytochrome c oxidase subunit 4